MYERRTFHGRIQHPDETINTFYSDICNLVKTYEIGDLAEDMIRDRIVSGIKAKITK